MTFARRFLLEHLALVFVLLLGLPTVLAQDPQQEQKKKDDELPTIRVNTDLVVLDVSVTDRDGNRTNSGLRVEDFVVYENGVRQIITSFDATEVPFNLVLLIDTSGSTRGDVELMRRAARGFLNELRPQDRVALVQFNKEVELLKDLTADRRAIEGALELLTPGTGTSFYDAMQLTMDEVLSKVEGRKAIVALTDGVDSYGYRTYQQILPLMEKNRVSAYFLELDTESFTGNGMVRDCADENHFEFSAKQFRKYASEFADKNSDLFFASHCRLTKTERLQINRRLYEVARREVREMADKTGGRVYPVAELRQLDKAYSQIAAELRTQYSLAYYPKNEAHDGKWRNVKVEVKKPGFIARTRPGYRSPID
ncbi:MAG: VWA domain-containing protein [Acidobacteria bacterium]|nr:VWA domain-containing protein [Acidobacteriota bacterium]